MRFKFFYSSVLQLPKPTSAVYKHILFYFYFLHHISCHKSTQHRNKNKLCENFDFKKVVNAVNSKSRFMFHIFISSIITVFSTFFLAWRMEFFYFIKLKERKQNEIVEKMYKFSIFQSLTM